ncbi:o-succinylbenzoate synthase [Candidatus Pantoea multigeneris]|uniref:o-succinylbenzoate synthase n=1 Tax=Candidatus Pantoea multigeneris TaxID=2608357 RepID=A0ABX0R6D8_9GAMM|nr:o-succinylbenzoate synthase [Pantoea multigeneris]NIF20667.1 o-succinylbenzoate synthase [Pantoea multigeneris]
MKIDKIVLRKMKMALKTPFTTSFATQTEKHFSVVEVHAGGVVGYGDCSAISLPFYNEETNVTAWHIMRDFLIPMLKQAGDISHPSQAREIFAPVKRNNCAKAAIEGGLWDAWAKQQGISLAKAIGGERTRVEAGVSIGIQSTPDKLIEVVDGYLNEGYKRIKIKIKPGYDFNYVQALRQTFGDITLMVDANSAYTLDDIDLFKRMDQFGLLMIEQPLAHDDIIDHRKLQAAIATPICLDESIASAEDARKALELGSGKIINIKVARVGGITEVKMIHDLCQQQGVPVWCGGMLDTAVGKAHNIAIASLPNFVFAHDIPPSSRYWHEDFMLPQVEMDRDSCVAVPEAPGIGFAINPGLYQEYCYGEESFSF